jgi:hypothetical protein
VEKERDRTKPSPAADIKVLEDQTARQAVQNGLSIQRARFNEAIGESEAWCGQTYIYIYIYIYIYNIHAYIHTYSDTV